MIKTIKRKSFSIAENIRSDYSFYIILLAFTGIFLVMAAWLDHIMVSVIRANNENQVAEMATVRSRRIQERTDYELNELKKVADYLDLKGLEHVSLLSAYSTNTDAREGVMDLQGNLQVGAPINVADFPNIKESLRGKPSISFDKVQGVLFSVPIFRDGNVQYVLYRHYSNEYVKNNFGLATVEVEGIKISVVDSQDNMIVPFSGYTKEDELFFKSKEMSIHNSQLRDKMKRADAASVFFESKRGRNYLFMSAIPNTDFYLTGYFSEDLVSGNVFKTIYSLLVFYVTIVIMIACFMIFYRLEVNEKRMQLEERRRMVEQLNEEIINVLAMTIDAKDAYTKGHSQRVADYSVKIAKKLDWNDEDCAKIKTLGLLHDIGKIAVPDAVLNKNGKLTDEEYEIIKSHTSKGCDILQTIKTISDIWQGARWHHERYDGRGYPDGKAGEDIPIEERIIAVADTYDAMTSKRCYRDALPQDVVRKEIEKCSGTQFDPVVAKAMLDLIDEDRDYEYREK